MVITSSPFPMFNDLRDNTSASVPFFTAIAQFTLKYFLKLFSNFFTSSLKYNLPSQELFLIFLKWVF